MIWSVPGARPSPRSIRSPYSVASVPYCSATMSGAWLGSMTPPEPTRIDSVWLAMWASSTDVAELANVTLPWCSAIQKRV